MRSSTVGLRQARLADGSARYFTSNRRTDDQFPGAPEASFARTRHHILVVGSVLVEKLEALTVWVTIGDEKVSASSITIV